MYSFNKWKAVKITVCVFSENNLILVSRIKHSQENYPLVSGVFPFPYEWGGCTKYEWMCLKVGIQLSVREGMKTMVQWTWEWVTITMKAEGEGPAGGTWEWK